MGLKSLTGGSSGNWTSDTRIFSPLLYRLSYEAKWRFVRDLNPWSLAWQASVIGLYTNEPWLREKDLNLRPSGYEPDELPDCYHPAISNIKLAKEKGFEPLRRIHDLSVFKTDPFNRTWVFLHALFSECILIITNSTSICQPYLVKKWKMLCNMLNSL